MSEFDQEQDGGDEDLQLQQIDQLLQEEETASAEDTPKQDVPEIDSSCWVAWSATCSSCCRPATATTGAWHRPSATCWRKVPTPCW